MDNKFTYYSDQPQIIFKEYGRNVQKIADEILRVEDREKRTRMAFTLIELMKQLNPNVGDALDYVQKLWDHLHIITDFQLDVDGPYPVPDRTILIKKPNLLTYNQHNLTFRHYGYQMEQLVKKAIEITDPETRFSATVYIGRLLKMFYQQFNKELLEDVVVIEHIKRMSKGELLLPLEKVQAENLLSLGQDKGNQRYPGNGSHQNQGGQNRNQGSNFKRKDKNRRKY